MDNGPKGRKFLTAQSVAFECGANRCSRHSSSRDLAALVADARNNLETSRLGLMNPLSKIIGTELRRIFAALQRPMGWNLIDAFARLEEREERNVDAEEADSHRDEPDIGGTK